MVAIVIYLVSELAFITQGMIDSSKFKDDIYATYLFDCLTFTMTVRWDRGAEFFGGVKS